MTKRSNRQIHRSPQKRNYEAIVRTLASESPYIAATYSLYVDKKYTWIEFLIASIELLNKVEQSQAKTIKGLVEQSGIELQEPEDFTLP